MYSDAAPDAASMMKDTVSNLGRSAVQSIDKSREAAAAGLNRAASALDNAQDLPGGEKIAGLAHATAKKLGVTAEYVRQNDLNAMMADMTSVIKRNPGPSLVAAGMLGFLVGRAFRSDD